MAPQHVRLLRDGLRDRLAEHPAFRRAFIDIRRELARSQLPAREISDGRLAGFWNAPPEYGELKELLPEIFEKGGDPEAIVKERGLGAVSDTAALEAFVDQAIAANPNVEISAFKDGKWIRLSGELVEDDRREARVSMLDAYPELKAMYDPDDGNTVVYYFKNATAVFCSFTEAPETVQF